MGKLAADVRIHMVRTMGGNKKFRALRLNHGNFGWASEGISKVSRIVDVVYHGTPFRQFYENHYSIACGRKKNWEPTEEEKANLARKDTAGEQTKAKLNKRERTSEIEKELESQFMQGKLLAKINSRPGQSGRADGYILEGAELEFYVKRMKTKKGK